MQGDRTTRILLLVTIALLCVNLVIMLGRPAQAQYRPTYATCIVNPSDTTETNTCLNQYARQGYTVVGCSAYGPRSAFVILRK